MITAVPTANITPQRIVFYEYLDGIRRGGSTSEASRKNLEDNNTQGKISQAARKRLSAGVNWLYALSPTQRHFIPELRKSVSFRISLITLTLSSPQIHSDQEIKAKLLNAFLMRMRRQYGMKSYLWRAETQANGNIHFHITTNVFIHYLELRRIWNEVQNNLGYIDRYIASGGNADPNSTDIHAVQKVRNLAAYICKYLAKDSPNRPVDGRQWFLSSNLSAIPPISIVRDSVIEAELNAFISGNRSRFHIGEHATVIFACIFSGNTKKYPLLNSIKTAAIAAHSPSVN